MLIFGTSLTLPLSIAAITPRDNIGRPTKQAVQFGDSIKDDVVLVNDGKLVEKPMGKPTIVVVKL